MAFMDQIGQKLANIGQNLSQQSNNLANVTRISNDINENQRKITQLYATIGKAYYERHKSDPGAEEFECIAEINLLLAEIAEQENRMEQMKGTGKCAECGADTLFIARDGSFDILYCSTIPMSASLPNKIC